MRSVRFRGGSKRLSAAEINRWNELANQRARGELRSTPVPNTRGYDPNSRIAFCKNTSGNDRAAGDCMAIEGLLWDLATSGIDDVVFELKTCALDKPPVILLEPIENDGFGRAVIYGPALANVAAGTVTDDYAYPQASTHSLKPNGSGPIRLLASPSASATTLLPVIIGSDKSGVQQFGWNAVTAGGDLGLEGTISTGGVDMLSSGMSSHLVAKNCAYLDIDAVITDTGLGGSYNHNGLQFNRPGRYRIITELTVDTTGSTSKCYGIQFNFYNQDTTNQDPAVPHAVQGTVWRDQTIDAGHTFVTYVDVAAGETIKPRISGRAYHTIGTGAGTLRAETDSDILGTFSIELIEPYDYSMVVEEEAPPP